MKLLEGFKVVSDAPKLLVLNCYDLVQVIYLRILLRLSKARLRKKDAQITRLALQCTGGKKMLEPVEHDVSFTPNVELTGAVRRPG